MRIVAAILVIAMTATTFTTQRQLMTKNMPTDAMTGPYAQQQKMLLYVLPVVFAVGGIAFPIGVLVYWTTTNLWTMGQQFYVIRNNPAPGTPAFDAKLNRDRAKGIVVDRAGGAGRSTGGRDSTSSRAPPRDSSRSGRPKSSEERSERDRARGARRRTTARARGRRHERDRAEPPTPGPRRRARSRRAQDAPATDGG